MAYNRYQGNSGRVQRVEEPQGASAPPRPVPPRPGPGEGRPPGPVSGLSGELGRLLGRLSPMNLETEDLLLIAVLYLLYRDSGDEDFLFMIGGLLFL